MCGVRLYRLFGESIVLSNEKQGEYGYEKKVFGFY